MNKPDGLYDLLLDATSAPELTLLAEQGRATLEVLKGQDRRLRLVDGLRRLLPDLLEELAHGNPDGADNETSELALLNQILVTARKASGQAGDSPQWVAPTRVLRSLHRSHQACDPPAISLSAPWLFAAGKGDPSLISELRRELASADQVDILVSFITWSGVRQLLDILRSLTALDAHGQPGTRIRVLTTTYIGATETKAIQALAELPGVEVRISLDGRRTRLHAKAWIFNRASGFGTAFVGSANLTGAALMGGLEWTVRFTQSGQNPLFESARAHFETLWKDPEFQAFDSSNSEHLAQLKLALKEESGWGATVASHTWFDLQPKQYQQEMLDRLAAERRHGRTRNLLVAATGTGKTVVAAFDYKGLCQLHGGRPRLLFVAHRKEILQQAQETYRQVLRQSDFGEVLADGNDPEHVDHLFATIQSLLARGYLERFGFSHWHTVVIDECHHLPAASFDAFARGIQPAILLGLTATPERADGASIAPYFQMRPDGSPAVELRLWEALDQQLLAPFEYFGVVDETDFTRVRWNQAGELADISNLVTGNTIRARRILDAFRHYCAVPDRARTLGFCVSVAHAEFMAEHFRAAGLKAIAVTGGTSREQRARVPELLARREIAVVFTCDLYNEGVDLPDVDTLLLLRPTQSPVLFQQQIGRGLRLAHGKTSCLVLDFVGRHRQDFRFDRLYQVLTGFTRRRLIEEVEAGFPSLPPGCHILLERIARERVLENVRLATTQNWRHLQAEIRSYATLPGKRNPVLADFLRDQGLALGDLYRSQTPSGWIGLRRAVGLELQPETPDEAWLGKRLGDLLHADDPDYLALWQRAAEPGCQYRTLAPMDQARLQMLAYQIYPQSNDVFDGPTFLDRLQANPRMAEELGEIGQWLEAGSDLDPQSLPGTPPEWPLRLHGAYEIREILTAVGWLRKDRRAPFQSGVLPLPEVRIELLFVTLDKREGYHAGIAYHDYAISPERFHWQTQNSAGPDTMAGKRYLESGRNGWRFQLFVREDKNLPYRALGPVVLVSAEGDRPMSITWQLEVPLPAALLKRYSVLRG